MNNDNNIQNQINTQVAQPQAVAQPVPAVQPQVVAQSVAPVQAQPVAQPVVQTQSVQPVAVQQTPVAPSVSNDIPAPAEATVIDNNAPGAGVIPTVEEEQVILDNSQKKSGSNFVLIILILLLVVGLMFAEDIMLFIENNIIASDPTGVGDGNGDSLVGGYLLLNDVNGNMTVRSIKFYNLKKNSNNFTIGLNYESDLEFKNISEENIYIEVYNSNKELLYKHLFDVKEKISKNVVRTYSFELDADVFEDSFYALVKTYSNAELEKITNLSCKYRASNEGYNELYKHFFTFKSDMLVSYSVDKKVEVSATSTSSTIAMNNIKKEYDALEIAKLPATYSEGSLVYNIDLETLEADYIPLYKKGTSSLSVKNKEVFKKWECE